MLSIPPFKVNFKCGKSLIRAYTNSYLRGGMVRFAAGLRPFNIALRECIMKCSVGDIEATVATKLSGNKPLSDSCIDQKLQGCMQGQ
jgi:hypothetical protein